MLEAFLFLHLRTDVRNTLRRKFMSTDRLFDPDSITVQFTERRTAGVTETTVGVLVPVLGTREVRPRPVGPEDGADGLGAAIGGEGLNCCGRVSQYGTEELTVYSPVSKAKA